MKDLKPSAIIEPSPQVSHAQALLLHQASPDRCLSALNRPFSNSGEKRQVAVAQKLSTYSLPFRSTPWREVDQRSDEILEHLG
jgi:hypothetical protein